MSYGQRQTRFKPRKRKRSPILVVVLLTSALVYVVLEGTATTTPVDALSRAQAALENKQLDRARSLLSLPVSDERLSPWAFLLSGQLAEVEGKPELAVAQYKRIPDTSAAFLDAQLGLLRLGLGNEGESPVDLLTEVESKVSRAFRKDLREALLLAKGVVYGRAGDELASVTALNELRKLYPTSRYAERARTLLNELYVKNKDLSPTASVSNAVVESAILTLEDNAIAALDLLQKQLPSVPDRSEEYFKLRFAQERVLRKLKRNEEADHLLLVLSADAGAGVADEALLRVAKNHWNVNDQGQALTFIDSLQTRFPQSPLTDDALYTKARILEEIEELADARDTYTTLIARTQDQLLKVRAWGRIAWLYLRGENYPFAAAQFDSMRQAATEALRLLANSPDQNSAAQIVTAKRDLNQELLHATFWELYSLSRSEKAQVTQLPYKAPNLEDLKPILSTGGAINYYSLLAQKHLKMPVVKTPATSIAEEQCFEPGNKQLMSLLEALSSGGLRNFADHEINWYFFRSGLLPTDYNNLSDADIRNSFARVRLQNTYGQPQTGVATAESLLRSETSSALIENCRGVLLKLAFPTPYREEFDRAHAASGAPLSLLYAIARTESYFDPRAVSRTGAQGLMQLMPATAKQEGLGSHDDIFDPKINALLGSKHLRRLLEEQDQNQTFAIAAYNAGSAPVNRWKTRYESLAPLLWTEMIGYSETKDYVKKVSTAQAIYEQILSEKIAATVKSDSAGVGD